jgi:hypothetical protein
LYPHEPWQRRETRLRPGFFLQRGQRRPGPGLRPRRLRRDPEPSHAPAIAGVSIRVRLTLALSARARRRGQPDGCARAAAPRLRGSVAQSARAPALNFRQRQHGPFQTAQVAGAIARSRGSTTNSRRLRPPARPQWRRQPGQAAEGCPWCAGAQSMLSTDFSDGRAPAQPPGALQTQRQPFDAVILPTSAGNL